MNPDLIAFTKALLFSCHQKILIFDFVTTPTRVGGRSKVYKVGLSKLALIDAINVAAINALKYF